MKLLDASLIALLFLVLAMGWNERQEIEEQIIEEVENGE